MITVSVQLGSNGNKENTINSLRNLYWQQNQQSFGEGGNPHPIYHAFSLPPFSPLILFLFQSSKSFSTQMQYGLESVDSGHQRIWGRFKAACKASQDKELAAIVLKKVLQNGILFYKEFLLLAICLSVLQIISVRYKLV